MSSKNNLTPDLTVAGTWEPVDVQYLTASYIGNLADTLYSSLTLPDGRLGLAIGGWAWAPNATANVPTGIAILARQPDGTMALATSTYVSDALTYGIDSVKIADFNADGKQDIFLGAYNETPWIAEPSVIYLSNTQGRFDRVTTSSTATIQSSTLSIDHGVPVVYTATFPPGDPNPIYSWNGSSFATRTLSDSIAADTVAIADFEGDGKQEILFGDFLFGPGYPYTGKSALVMYELVNGTTIAGDPVNVATPYFNDKPAYAGLPTQFGSNLTDIPRVWVDDFNHDGKPDILAAADIWSASAGFSAAVLQMIQNKGDLEFADVTDSLNPDYEKQTNNVDSSLQMLDLDHSGINSYLGAGTGLASAASGLQFFDPSEQTNFVLLNDGTGRLYYLLQDQFIAIGERINEFINASSSTTHLFTTVTHIPKFYGYLTTDGLLNFVAEAFATTSISGKAAAVDIFVNVPTQIDIDSYFTRSITIVDRNGSHLIRTFAGNDVINSGNDGGYSHVDGGLGVNKLVYGGAKANCTIASTDGAITVQDNVGADGVDTLVNFQTLSFTDKTVIVGPGWLLSEDNTLHGDAYVAIQGRGLAAAASVGTLVNDDGRSPSTSHLVTGPAHGTLQLTGDGSFSYSATTGFYGIDGFIYSASDNDGSRNAQALIYVVPVDVGASTTLNLLALDAEEQIAATYVTFFGRGADASGFHFWVGQFQANLSQGGGALFANIASSFGVSDEAKGLYPFLVNPFAASDAQIGAFLDSVYLNLFNRGPDAAGLAYWTGQTKATLAAGQFVGSILVNIMSGAQDTADGKDITTLMGKVAVSLAYVHEQDVRHTLWAGAGDTALATTLLHAVTSDPQSVLVGVRNAETLVASHA